MIIAIKDFIKQKGITFKTVKEELNWIRKLRPDTLIKIGETYFADETELQELFQKYVSNEITKQKRLRKQRAEQAKKNFSKRSKVSSTLSFQTQLEKK